MQHQSNHSTRYDRYPNVFQVCSEIISPKRILSFGSSTGEEAFTLSEKYFTSSKIIGVECDESVLDESIKKNSNPNIVFKNTIKGEEPFDAIFCMSVLCRWGDTKDLLHSTGVYEFKMFDSQIKELDSFLNIGGLMVIYNANFLFCESSIFEKYEAHQDNRILESGFVHKFNHENRRITSEYKDVIFVKKHV